jgi:magnesium chelatase subunit D
VIVVVTAGRATSAGPAPAAARSPAATQPAGDPTAVALAAAGEIAAAGIEALVVDAETGDIRLGLARRLADAMAAHYTALPDLRPDALARTVEAVVAAGAPS